MSDDSALILEQFLAIRADLAAIRNGMHEINAKPDGTLARIERQMAAILADARARRAARDLVHEQPTGL